ncbi:MAG TPA: glutathione peroxidase, partial [Bacilli bacterium]|nr:glutathione peroxidase [Bacilli bacterium]
MNIYQIAVEDVQGKAVVLEKYKGKVLLIVNTATQCV